MPFVGEAVDGGVFAHGGDGDAVGESEAPELQGGEEVVRGLSHFYWMSKDGFGCGGEIWTRFGCGSEVILRGSQRFFVVY
jgi:hypothetical protein